MTISDCLHIVDTGTRLPADIPPRIEAVHVPMLQVRPTDFDPDRLRRLMSARAAIVVYSRNAVAILESVWESHDLGPARRHEWWAVGPKTAEAIRARLGPEARTPDAPHFEGLREALSGRELPDRLVSLSLEGTFRDLGPVVAGRDTEFVDLPIYRTEPADYPDLAGRLDDLAPDWLVVTSSRGADTLVDNLERGGGDAKSVLGGIRIATIGPKTADRLDSHDVLVDYVPPEPDRQALYRRLAVA